MDLRTNVIEERKRHGDFQWSLKTYVPCQYNLSQKRNPQQIKQYVLHSARVQHTISQISENTGKTLAEVTKEATVILDEMGHQLQLGTIRTLAFVLSKLMKRLYTGIYVNPEGIEKVKTVLPDHPILFMPSHRSYVDFLLVSYLCFMYGLPMPVIAAGLDFLSMKGLNRVLRNAGAFFIRRSFGQDQLYWSIFTEYVDAHIINGDAPVEFFVEGTRSRTAKTLTPKLGFLMAALEPYFKRQVSDITILPMNITYDRTLEEKLYAYELLGVPKPKESTKGLFKARQILDECFGGIHVQIGEPILLSQFCNKHEMKHFPHIGPRYLSPLNAEEQRICRLLAYHVVRKNQINAVISSFSLLASILLIHLQQGHLFISVEDLAKRMLKLKQVMNFLGAKIDWNECTSIENLIIEIVQIHHSTVEIVEIQGVTSVHVIQHNNKSSLLKLNESSLKGHSLDSSTVVCAVPHMLLSHYSNQMIHVFIRTAFVTSILYSLESTQAAETVLFAKYVFLEKLFGSEFIFEAECSKMDFDFSIQSLKKLQLVEAHNHLITLKNPEHMLIIFLQQLLHPFLISYRVVCHQILYLSSQNKFPTASVIKQHAQAHVEMLLRERSINHYVSLSLDILNNAIFSLLNLGAIQKQKRNGDMMFSCQVPQLLNIVTELDQLIQFARLTFEDIPLQPIASKL